MLPRTAKLEGNRPTGPPPEQDIPLDVPKRTAVYVEQVRLFFFLKLILFHKIINLDLILTFNCWDHVFADDPPNMQGKLQDCQHKLYKLLGLRGQGLSLQRGLGSWDCWGEWTNAGNR